MRAEPIASSKRSHPVHRRRVISCCLGTILVAAACTGATDRDGAPSAAGVVQPSPSESVDDGCSMPDELRPPPPTNALRGRIAYGQGTSEVVILDLATGRTTQVTSREGSRGWDFDPSFSPDGRTITYRSEHPGDAEIRTVDLDTGEDRALTDNLDEDWSPAYSPDGRTIAYATDHGGSTTHIAVMPAGGGETTVLARSVQGEYPTWSPDGEQIAFASQVGSGYEIFVVPADGSGTPERLTEDSAHNFLPAWSPDGSTIVFQSNRCASGERTDLYAMDADGSNLRRLTKGFAEQPTWSPDGRWLVFNSFEGLAVMDARGGETRSLGLGTGTLPDWSDP